MKFSYEPRESRVIFGSGCVAELPAEVERLGIVRALLFSRRRDLVGDWPVGVFEGAVTHVPRHIVVEARAQAERLRADGLVAIGGGSTIGLAKAVALETSLPIVAVPTTYSGSERTSIWGITEEERKATGRDPRVVPKTVIYDSNLLRSLPLHIAGPSGINAIAHAAEALYAENENPVLSLMSEEAIRIIAKSLPHDHEQSLFGAFLAGTALESVGMSLHHKLCHTLGGTFALPHAMTHSVILPHAIAYNREAAPEAMACIARALGAAEAAAGLFDFAGRLSAPHSLKELGMREGDLERAAEIAVQVPYYNPRPVTREGVRALLDDAFHGRRP